MLRSYETGYAVMNEQLNAFSIEDTSLETCKRYCRKGDVIAKRIPYVCGYSIRVTWHKYWSKKINFNSRFREANIFYLHLNWNKEYLHKTGEIVHRG